MNVSTRARAKTADSATRQTSTQTRSQRRESNASQPPSNAYSDETLDNADGTERQTNEPEGEPDAHMETPVTAVAPDAQEASDIIAIPTQNIRQFKEAVVNTSKLLKVFGEQEKELTKAKAEIAKCTDEIKRMNTMYQGLQRDFDGRTRELARANAETENAKSLLALREGELTRTRGLKEDLEAKINEMQSATPAVEQLVPPKSPNAGLMEEIERLKGEIEVKDGTIKSLRISRDGIRSSTRAEVISIQARYAREQSELIERQEREMAQHRSSLVKKETELEAEQERLMQLEMDLSMRSTQLEDQAAELRASLETMTAKYEAARKDLKALEDQNKGRTADSRSEIAKLTRASKRDEKRISDLEAALERAKSQAKENARQRPKPRPKSTSTAAEAVLAATEDVEEMDMEELREEVRQLRVDAVHKDETIRKLGVMNEELERKQNPEGRRSRGKAAALQAEIDELQSELAIRDRKIEKLEGALHISQQDADSQSKDANPAAAIAQLELKILSLEATLKEKDGRLEELERQLAVAKEAANERPMRLRHAAAVQGVAAVGGHGDKNAVAAKHATSPMSGSARGDRLAAAAARSSAASRQNTRLSSHMSDNSGSSEALYAEVAGLRARVEKMQQERLALQELVTEQQVKIRQLRISNVPGSANAVASHAESPGLQQKQPSQPPPFLPAASTTPTPAQRKRIQEPPTMVDEIEQAGAIVAKRAKQGAHSSNDTNGCGAVSSKSSDTTGTQRIKAVASSASNGASASELNIESMERLLRDRRISSINRTRRFFVLLQKSPHIFSQKLLAMLDGVLALDAIETRAMLMSLVATTAAQPESDIRLVASAVDVEHPIEPGKKLTGLYQVEADIAISLWALCFKNSLGGFFAELMKHLAQNIVAPPDGYSGVATCSITRVFTALALLSNDIQRVRVMLCDLLMEAVDSAHTLPVLSSALAVWPAALATPAESVEGEDEAEAGARVSLRLVVRVVQAIASGIHDLYAEEQGREEADSLYQIMVDRCGWRAPSDAEFADKILVEVTETLHILDRESKDYAVVMCAYNLLSPYISAETVSSLP
ncbi:hypothetical protein GGI15_002242 [Coemansia interrupta]|uniref:Uncharacterized protein n=1 Tax=Coemansia interrupta TaxID=1126814 RepID=A0A9W8HKS7_9FUNG|nr:hypothetical protein GGI15_002242 [Coemansia interrupta]